MRTCIHAYLNIHCGKKSTINNYNIDFLAICNALNYTETVEAIKKFKF